MATIDKVRTSLFITTTAYDEAITDLIEAAKIDLGIAGVSTVDETDKVCLQAITTYCQMRFGNPENYDKLKQSYDEQKAQLVTATGYTDWGDEEDV